MKSEQLSTAIPLVILVICAFVISQVIPPILTHAQSPSITTQNSIGGNLEDELNKVKSEISNIQKEKENLKANKIADQNNLTEFQKQIFNLQTTVEELSLTIQQKELEINQLELEIELLQKEIEELIERIEDNQDQIEALEEETDERLLGMYLAQKQNSSSSSKFFASDSPSEFVKVDTYRQALQEDTNVKLELLDDTRTQLEKDQTKLEEDKITLDRSREQVEDEKIAIDIQRTTARNEQAAFEARKLDAQNRLSGYDELIQVLSSKEKDLLAKQDSIQSALLARNEIVSGVPVDQGAFLGVEGDTGYAYGAHLHFGVSESGVIKNPCNYLPGGSYGSCGGSGRIGKPMGGGVLTSGFRTQSRPTHNAIDISTGGGANIVAAHGGYTYFFFEPCPSWAKVCNAGGAIVAKVCEVDKCASGLATSYYHLRCTAEPASSPRSCQ
ncbi:hypothetical protein KC717_00095 [Candidatus Dojkabacteria bacterium]|uniref:Peptidase M23 domain-containing protein n=1 Tax=Candidatus Dojkabacteria bacterium TaxID=2099670 RepID=A0A955L7E0_9BACT|nr:hypothetical protein [Candidatus Dojkabacteria bacterium]